MRDVRRRRWRDWRLRRGQGGGHQGVVGDEKIISGDVTLYKYGISSIQY